jgi:hypothetical protein
MILRNGKVHRWEDGVPGCPVIDHLGIQAACERFFEKRRMATASFRKSVWLFGAKDAKRRAAA